MKLTFKLTLLLFLALSTPSLQAQEYWKKKKDNDVTQTKRNTTKLPTKYQVFELQTTLFKNLLKDSPMRGINSADNGIEVLFPMADGTLKSFSVFEAPVLDAELSARYPGIKSYAGQGIDDPSEIVRFSVSQKGLSSMLFSTNGYEFIEPYTEDYSHYYVYKRKDRHREQSDFECAVMEAAKEKVDKTIRNNADDGNLRTYRVAISTTGEYAQYHGGTVADALAAMNVSMTRVNGIYEVDFNVTMTLINNTTDVIYTNSSTDPYSSSSGQWNSQLQSTLTSNIGEANYDVGHLFAQGPNSGNAGCIGCVCVNNQKGSGWTSRAIPEGDPFDVDYVAHEFGHQFGGNHTWTHGGNEGTNVQMEPGSGSTIMGYAGITGATDVQANSDPYFHAVSIEQITDYVKSTSCQTTESTGNNVPTADAGPNYTIPRGTPFELTGVGTDADGDALTYCWEQMDENNASTTYPSATATTGVAFRSIESTDSPVRTFPALPTVLAGSTATQWEVVPNVGRTLNFRFTVRDNVAGGGTNESDNMVVTVNGSTGPFVVNSPNTNVSWPAGSSQTVTWDVAGTNGSPVNATNVNILLSTDGGNTFNTTIVANTPNDGSQVITVPNFEGTTNRIKVQGSNNIFFDISDTDFSITGNVPCTATTPTNLAASSITSSSAVLSWDAVPGAASYDVRYRVVGAPSWTTILATGVSTTLTGLTELTNYEAQVRSTCPDASNSPYSTSETFSTPETPLNYCASNGNNATEEYIGNVTIAEINNTTANAPGGYADFTNLVASLTIGESANISITPIWPGTTYAEGYSVWIDYNKDGDFADAGEQVFTQAATTATPINGSFTPPASASLGTTRMRVSMKYNDIPDPCESFTYGEVEDYTVDISDSSCEVGGSCDDGDVCTVNDVYDADCNCSGTFADADGDGICDANDQCPGFDDSLDVDGDGIPDGCDACNNNLDGTSCDDGDACTINDVYDNNCNCAGTFADADGDGVCDADDICPGGNDNADEDGDGTPDFCDACNNNLDGTACDDGDACTINDEYDNDCNCAGTFEDSDGDGVCDADDACPGSDDNIDGDGDGIPDGCDTCDNSLEGTSCDDLDACTINDVYDADCNCAGTFEDTDGDGVCDADDICPGGDDNSDVDGDGTPDACDACNNNLEGTSCDDLDACTINDVYDANCNCAGTFQDSDGDGVCDADDQCPGGDDNLDGDGDGIPDACDTCDGSLDGTACDDGDACTINDVYDIDCNCAGTFQDGDGDGVCDDDDVCPGFDDTIDGDNDGVPDGCDICLSGDDNVDTDGDGTPDACDACNNNLEGTSCDDGDACTTGDVYDADCNCAGTFQDGDSDGVCDADDACPGSDDNQDADGDGVPDGCDICAGGDDNVDTDGDGTPDACDACDNNLEGTSCDDGDACTIGDVYDSDCNCAGTFQDADGDGVCDADDICPGGDDNADEDGDGTPDACDACNNNLVGTPCDDGDACTTGDIYDANCNCVGTVQDADGDGVCDADDLCPNSAAGNSVDANGCVAGCTDNTAHNFDVNAQVDDGSCETCTDGAQNGDETGVDCGGALCGPCNTTYCNSNGNNTNDEYISNVSISNINNTTGASAGGYGDYTNLVADIFKNQTTSITITPTWTGTIYNEAYSVWIDYNSDGDFTDAGEQVFTQSPTTATPINGSFTVPNTSIEGSTRMRVSMKYNGIPTSCESFTWGEVEDYTVNISADGCVVGSSCDDGDACTVSDVFDANCNCAGTYADSDNDGVCDGDDACPGSAAGASVDANGCVPGCTDAGAHNYDATAQVDDGSCETCDDGILNGDEEEVDCGGALCAPCNTGGCTFTTFNSNNFDSGWGIWNDGGSDCRRSSNDQSYANTGLYCIRLRDNTSTSTMTTDNLNLSAYSEVKIEFNFLPRSMDNSNEDLWLQVSTNGGSTYTTVEDWRQGIDFTNLVREFEEVTIPGPFTSNTRFRFRLDASGNSDWCYIDDVVISVCSNSARGEVNTEIEINENNTISDLVLQPNPTSNYVDLVYNAAYNSTSQMYILDVTGKVVMTQTYENQSGRVVKHVDVSRLDSGIYFVTMVTNKQRLTKRLVIVE